MKLVASQRCDYGVKAVVFLASCPDGHASGEEICSATGAPVTAIRDLMQTLARARLVQSRPGRHGGYSFGADPQRTSIRNIVEAIEGPIDPEYCGLRGIRCPAVATCTLHEVWQRAQTGLARDLESVTVADLRESAGEETV